MTRFLVTSALLVTMTMTLLLTCLVRGARGGDDVCMTCPASCGESGCKPDGRCCKYFDDSSLSLVSIVTPDCSKPEESYITRPSVSFGGSVANASQCIGFHLYYNGGCLTSLPDDVCSYNSTIRALTIVNSNLSKFPDLSCLPLLGRLQLSNNRLQELPVDAFKGVPNIRDIYLDNNEISYIHPESLEGLTQLNKFSMSYNQLVAVDANVFMLSYPFCVFWFDHNRLSAITNEQGLNLGSWKTYGPGFVDLSYNNFTGGNAKEIFRNLGFRGLQDLSIVLSWGFDFRGNPLHCDCRMYGVAYWLQELKAFIDRNYFDVRCASPAELAGVRLFDVNLRQLVCNVTTDCPAGCTCQDRPADDALVVNCSAASLTSLPEVMPEDEVYGHRLSLELDHNGLRRVEPRLYFKRARSVNLSGNNITDIDVSVPHMWVKAHSVDLRHNQLQSLPQTFQALRPQNLLLDVHGLRCTCPMLGWMPGWLAQAGKDQALSNVTCVKKDGETLTILRSDPSDLRCDKVVIIRPSPVHYALLAAGVGVLATVVVLLAVFRYEVLVVLQAGRNKWGCGAGRRGRKNLLQTTWSTSSSASFQVFVSVSSDSAADTSWVSTALLPPLEKACVTCYVPPRDMLPGVVYMDEVTKRVQDSDAAVVVLSPDYVTSNDALFQFRQAYSHLVARGHGRLVLLMSSPVCRREVRDPRLSAMLRLGMARSAQHSVDDVVHTLVALRDKHAEDANLDNTNRV